MTANGPLTPDTVVAFLQDVFARHGEEAYLGEPVTLAEHMLQGATLAQRGGYGETIVVAALLHDIGHFTSAFGAFSTFDTEDRFHDEAGAQVLGRFLPPVVTDCIRYHVAAKRYLCATDPAYFERLSEASVHSLNLQGGPMSRGEIAAFESNPNLDAIVQVRHLDDAGKQAGMETPPFGHFAPMVQRLVDRQCRADT